MWLRSFKSALGGYSMFVHVRLLAIWKTLRSACFANERLLTKLDQPCFSDEWRQISNLFRWRRILIPVLQTLVFFQMCMQKIHLFFFFGSHLISLPLIRGLRWPGNRIILTEFHLVSGKLWTPHESSRNFQRKVKRDQNVSYQQSCQISIGSLLSLATINSY